MPMAPPIACVCGKARQRGEACPGCGRGGKRAAQREYDATRPSPSRRGYDSHWLKARALKLSASPLCEDCEERGIVTGATEVHHVIKISVRPDLRLDQSNLMSLCRPCHSTRTIRGE